MTTEAQRRAQEKYDKSHTKSVMFKFNKENDSDILQRLAEVDNKQGYIKSLIRKDTPSAAAVLSIDVIREKIHDLALKYGIRTVYVFGSYARGDADPESDVDLLICGGEIHGLLEYSGMIDSMETCLGKKVDIVMEEAVNSDHSRAGERFKEHLDREKVLIYG